MANDDRIEVNPKIMLGKPVIRGTRIPVELLLRKLGEGAAEAQLLEAYSSLTPEDIRAAMLEALYVQGKKDGARAAFEALQGKVREAEKLVPHKNPGKPKHRIG